MKIRAAWLERPRGAVTLVASELKAALQDHRAVVRRPRLRLALRIALIGAIASVHGGPFARGEPGRSICARP